MTPAKPTTAPRKSTLAVDVDAVCELILSLQRPDGEIPWARDGKTDPWDHVESAVGLNIGGRRRRARLAFRWLAERQRPDGAWYASYRLGRPEDRTLDANMTSYVAVGVWHDFLISGDYAFLREMWPTVEAAVDFVVGLQAETGEVYWAVSPEGVIDPMALLTGSSSVYMSLKCALAAAGRLGRDRPDWRAARRLLAEALRFRPHLFNMSKSRYSMDWFYPVLSGALTGADAARRIDKYWDKFVVQGQGVLCVSDSPWVTMAETSELVLALAAMGDADRARILFSWIEEKVFDDGTYWCGHVTPEMTIWPEDKMSWTNAVVLMAADALHGLTPAGCIFDHASWDSSGDWVGPLPAAGPVY